jgi:hypothetical protein
LSLGSAPVTTGDAFSAGEPVVLFERRSQLVRGTRATGTLAELTYKTPQ